MGKKKIIVKIIGVEALGGQVINLLLRNDFGSVAEQAVYIDKELFIDCAAGKMYFLENDGAEWRGFISKIKRLKKSVWPGEEKRGRILNSDK